MFWLEKRELKCPKCGHVYLFDRKVCTDMLILGLDIQGPGTTCPKCEHRWSMQSDKGSRVPLVIVIALAILALTLLTMLAYTLIFRSPGG